MFKNKNISYITVILAIINVLVVLIVNYGKISAFGLFGEGIKITELTEYSSSQWLLILCPIVYIGFLFMRDSDDKTQKFISIGIPIAGLLFQIISWFLIKSTVASVTSGLATITAGIGFYIVFITYLGIIIFSVSSLKGIDLGNENLNAIVEKISNMTAGLDETANSAIEKAMTKITQK